MVYWKILAFALAVLGGVTLILGANLFGQAIVAWDPDDPDHYASPAQANDPAERAAIQAAQDDVVTEGFYLVGVGAVSFTAAIGVLALHRHPHD